MIISPPHIKCFREGIHRVAEFKQEWRTYFDSLALLSFVSCQYLLTRVSYYYIFFSKLMKKVYKKSSKNFILLLLANSFRVNHISIAV